MMYFVLSFITVIILTLVAAQDFRERMHHDNTRSI